MRLHELGKTHVVPIARTGAQEWEIRHGEEGICAGFVPKRPPVETQKRKIIFAGSSPLCVGWLLHGDMQ